MDVVIERVMHTFRMVQDLTGDQDRDAREKVRRFLSKQTETDEHKFTVRGLTYLIQMKNAGKHSRSAA